MKTTWKAMALLLGCTLACASTWAWGRQPIKLIVPAPAGGTSDIVARVLGQQLSSDTGQPVIVENRAGAGGVIGMQALLAAPADGQTLLVGPSNLLAEIPHVIKMPFDPLRQSRKRLDRDHPALGADRLRQQQRNIADVGADVGHHIAFVDQRGQDRRQPRLPAAEVDDRRLDHVADVAFHRRAEPGRGATLGTDRHAQPVVKPQREAASGGEGGDKADGGGQAKRGHHHWA